jgi:hypothetical protein
MGRKRKTVIRFPLIYEISIPYIGADSLPEGNISKGMDFDAIRKQLSDLEFGLCRMQDKKDSDKLSKACGYMIAYSPRFEKAFRKGDIPLANSFEVAFLKLFSATECSYINEAMKRSDPSIITGDLPVANSAKYMEGVESFIEFIESGDADKALSASGC